MHALRYRLERIGFKPARATGGIAIDDEYELKASPASSHRRLLDWLDELEPSRVLDLGCADGWLAQHARKAGHEVVGVDVVERPGVLDRVDRFVQADLDQGVPEEVGDGFDVVLATDVLEHVREPGDLLRQASGLLADGGVVFASIPNFGHWYPRLRVVSGRFDYDRRGILDQGHVRFFTRASFARLTEAAGFSQVRSEAVGVPFEVLERGGSGPRSALLRAVEVADRVGVAVRPTLFGYQFLYELRPTSSSQTGVGVDSTSTRPPSTRTSPSCGSRK
jgi:SAM-dependent methyltransferase